MLHTDIPHESHAVGVHLGTAGWNIVYVRLHGSPRVYYSAYPAERLGRVARILEEKASRGISTWCIFDNTALGAATADAHTVKTQFLASQRVTT